MVVQFIGAARTVTGSMHLLEVNGKRILLDCGLFQGKRSDTFERNKNFPFDPASIDALVLSHAHIDHAGNLPNLVKSGYDGPIYCTPATFDLCTIMLKDSAYIQERDVEFVGKKHKKMHLPPPEPLYTLDDVEPTLKLMQSMPYHRPFEVARGVQVEFVDAGHILGSASVVLTILEGGDGKSSVRQELKFGFTGDLGRPNLPILRDPEFLGNVDFLISESTYGGRLHAPVEEMPEKFQAAVSATANRGGKVIIPAFSVGRTQELVYAMHLMKEQGRLQNIPVFVDSPLSTSATEVFRKHPECFDDETLALLKREDDPFGFNRLTYIREVGESKKLNERTEPCIIIASSGMCEAGRIRHHIANNIGDPRNTIMIVGYQAEHTLGRRLVEQEKEVTIFGEVHERKCQVVVMNSFSAHADRNELLTYFDQFDRNRLKNIFLVHGDPDQAEKFSGGLKEHGFKNVEIPVRLQKFDV